MNKILFMSCILLFCGGCSSEDYISVYPPAHSLTYVRVTTITDTPYYGYYATNPENNLAVGGGYNAWLSGGATNQRFHIDLGEAKTIKRIYYENWHEAGVFVNAGAKNFTFWGSNSADSFATLTYTTDTGWTQINTAVSTFNKHIAAAQADPNYITVTNTTAYRYYAFKFADGYGDGIGVTRIELQITVAEGTSKDSFFLFLLK